MVRPGALVRSGAALLRRHWLVTLLVCVAAVPRLAAMLAYRRPLAFADSYAYVSGAEAWRPTAERPFGYSAYLTMFLPLHHPWLVSGIQHTLGLAMVVGAYIFLYRRGVPRWLATLGVTLPALDAHMVTLEHYLLSETLFTAVLFAGVMALLSRGRMPAWRGALAGALLAATALIRAIGLPLLGIAALYLLVRRLGWRAVAAFALAAAIPLAGYSVWFHHYYDVYGLTAFEGRNLYARTATFVDCDRLRLTPQQRELCPKQPLGHRYERTDTYVWTGANPLNDKHGMTTADEPLMRSFALTAITGQPGDYVLTVLRETSWHLLNTGPHTDGSRCLLRAWQFPVDQRDVCQSGVYRQPDWQHTGPRKHALRTALHQYSLIGSTPGVVLTLCLLLTMIGVAWRRRGQRWRDAWRVDGSARLDAIVLGLIGLSMIVLSVATLMYDARYGVPSVLFISLGTALAANRIIDRTPPPAPAGSPPLSRCPEPDTAGGVAA